MVCNSDFHRTNRLVDCYSDILRMLDPVEADYTWNARSPTEIGGTHSVQSLMWRAKDKVRENVFPKIKQCARDPELGSNRTRTA